MNFVLRGGGGTRALASLIPPPYFPPERSIDGSARACLILLTESARVLGERKRESVLSAARLAIRSLRRRSHAKEKLSITAAAAASGGRRP